MRLSHWVYRDSKRNDCSARAFALFNDCGNSRRQNLQQIIHHGDCVGADQQVDAIAKAAGALTIIHPPVNPSKRAFCSQYKEIRPPQEYLKRNKQIVRETLVLLAAPHTMEETQRSGTWSTVRYALSQRKPVLVVYPDGSIRSHFAPPVDIQQQLGDK